MLYISLSSISLPDSSSICSTSEKIFYFASCIRGTIYKDSQKLSGRKLVFTYPSTIFPGSSFPQKVGHS